MKWWVIPVAIYASAILLGLWASFNDRPRDHEALLSWVTPEQRARILKDIEARRQVYQFCISRLPHEDCARIYRVDAD